MASDDALASVAKGLMAAAGYARNAGIDADEIHRLVDTGMEGCAIIPQLAYLLEIAEVFALETERQLPS